MSEPILICKKCGETVNHVSTACNGEVTLVLASSIGVTDPACIWAGCYVSNDRQWIWKRLPTVGDGWVKFDKSECNPPHTTQETAAQPAATERIGSMLYTVVVTTRPVVNSSTNQVVQPERIVAGPDNDILAPDQNVAMVVFGAKHAEAIEKVDPSLLVILVRQGV